MPQLSLILFVCVISTIGCIDNDSSAEQILGISDSRSQRQVNGPLTQSDLRPYTSSLGQDHWFNLPLNTPDNRINQFDQFPTPQLVPQTGISSLGDPDWFRAPLNTPTTGQRQDGVQYSGLHGLNVADRKPGYPNINPSYQPYNGYTSGYGGQGTGRPSTAYGSPPGQPYGPSSYNNYPYTGNGYQSPTYPATMYQYLQDMFTAESPYPANQNQYNYYPTSHQSNYPTVYTTSGYQTSQPSAKFSYSLIQAHPGPASPSYAYTPSYQSPKPSLGVAPGNMGNGLLYSALNVPQYDNYYKKA
ncbi:hypothetical protein HDE_05944 [Halotydeus destructor]|nr:hypothetical protein HDE_05944 [Halotydeus destructor]